MVSSYPVSQFFADSLTGHDADVLIYLRTITISRKRITGVFVRQKKERGKQRKPGDAKKNRGDKQLRQFKLRQEEIKNPGDARRKLEAAKMNVQKRRNNGKKRSSVENKRPGVKNKRPGVENKRPGVRKERPGVEKKRPGVEKERPDVEKKRPGIKKKRPIELPRR